MNILTISASPYINARNGRINRDLLLSLSALGHKVDSLVWHHDVLYFLPNETKKHHFNHQGQKVCDLYPFLGQQGEIGKFAYNVMKATQPQVVVSIGSYDETSFVANIKSLYPHLFRWVAILTSGINERFKESLDHADCVVAMNKGSYEQIRKLLTIPVVYHTYGADINTFKHTTEAVEDFGVLSCAKNSQQSNVPAFLMALGEAGVYGTLHTNLNDQGDYDLMLLMERYGLFETLCLPEKFVSVREGITQQSMNDLYNRHQVVVDCSMQSPTALSMLEGMATGCVPVGPGYGAVGDVLSAMAEEYRFVVPHEVFVGPREEEYAIVSPKGLASALKTLSSKFKDDKGWFTKARNEAISVSKVFSRDVFVSSVNHIIQDVASTQHAIVVDSFE
jgi:hypothetical protein